MKRQNGFSLIELCITLAIVGVLATLAIGMTSCGKGGADVAADGGGAPFQTSYVTATVTGKDRTMVGSGKNLENKFLIYTDSETFENTDSMLDGKLNCTDVQGRLQIGKRYRFKLRGMRSGFLSSFRNVVEYQEVSQ